MVSNNARNLAREKLVLGYAAWALVTNNAATSALSLTNRIRSLFSTAISVEELVDVLDDETGTKLFRRTTPRVRRGEFAVKSYYLPAGLHSRMLEEVAREASSCVTSESGQSCVVWLAGRARYDSMAQPTLWQMFYAAVERFKSGN